MKVLLLNGSPHKKGCTYTALCEIADELKKHGVDSEIFQIGTEPIRGCTACGGCARQKNNRCVFDDDAVNQFLDRTQESDGFVFGTPVHYASASGMITSLLDRAFYAGGRLFQYKAASCIASARRAGTTAALDQIIKYPTISNMIYVSSQYWNMVHGNTAEEVIGDLEGMQIMRTLGRNMAWVMKLIENGEQAGIAKPEKEKIIRTNFIR